jgi:hypothetical protein
MEQNRGHSALSPCNRLEARPATFPYCDSHDEAGRYCSSGATRQDHSANLSDSVQNLEKISRSGTLLEVMPNFVSDFTANGFPTKTDPDYQFYMAFSRAVK